MSAVQGAQAKCQEYLNTLDRELGKSYYMNEVQRRTGVPKSYFALGAGGVAFIMIFFNLAGQLLTNAISWLYPGKCHLKKSREGWPSNNTRF